MRKAIVMHPEDNVATLIRDVSVGEVVEVRVEDETKHIKAKQTIPFGHKIALRKIEKGENVIKYGEVIGKATKTIEKGEHVHVHNVKSTRGR